MRAVKSLLMTPAAKIAAGLLLLFSVILTQVPLFNYLGLEFSVVMAVLAGYVLGLTVLSWRRGEEPADHWWRSVGVMIGHTAKIENTFEILPEICPEPAAEAA